MSVREVIVDNSLRAAPSASYLAIFMAQVNIQTVVACLTGVLVALQIYKAVQDIRAAKRKEKLVCVSSTSA